MMEPDPHTRPDSTWQVSETEFDPEKQHHKETIFTIGNGYLSTRGTFEERYLLDQQATLVHGIWDDIIINYTELASAPDWTSLEIWVDGVRFDMSREGISAYRRWLDIRTGILHRRLRWSPDGGDTVLEIAFERFASLADQHILALQVTITPLKGNPAIRLRASLDSQVENEGYKHWYLVSQDSDPEQADLFVRTRESGKTLALSCRFVLDTENAVFSHNDSRGCPGIEARLALREGETLRAHKLVGIATSRDTDAPLALARQKVTLAWEDGYDSLRVSQREAWDAFWQIGDVRIRGDDQAQRALRHALFQLRIAAPNEDERVSIGAKALSGFGYKGHVFWDTEIFVLPFFTFTRPDLARNMLMYRYHTLDGARQKAQANGFAGAQYAWESAESGAEVAPQFIPDFDDPRKLMRIYTGDVQIHISADVAYALHQYWLVSGDERFWRRVGIPTILETAIFWGDRAEREGERYAIRNIIGPDEYHKHVDNNVFTNRMAQWHLDTALDALAWLRAKHPKQAHQLVDQLDLNPKRLDHWRDVRDNLIILQDSQTGLFEQFEGFFDLDDIDLGDYAGRVRSMEEVLGVERIDETQVIKQPDVIMLLCLLRDQFDCETWRANWDYYNPRTDHKYGSSLGPAMQAWAACEINRPDLAYEHFIRAARVDLDDARGNAADGIHAASAGGLWQAVVFGFAGLTVRNGRPSIDPRLPAHWQGVSFKFQYRGETYQVDIKRGESSITVI